MNNKNIYKEIKVTQNKPGQRDSGTWLRRIGMDVLVYAMVMLSADYGMAWADHWYDYLDDPRWLKRAMVNTFGRLSDEDQELVRALYEDWCWYAANLDLEALVDLGYAAEVYLLDRGGSRITYEGQYQTILVKLMGESRDDALCQLNRDFYEFIRWWN